MFATEASALASGRGKAWWVGAGLTLLALGVVWAVLRSPSQDLSPLPAASASLPALTESAPSGDNANTVEPASVDAAGVMLSARRLKPAQRDPFLLPVQPPPPPPPQALVEPVVQASPVVPSEPPPSITFNGRMVAPDGRVMVMAQWGDGTPVTLMQGKVLNNGYRVERLTDQMVELLNPQTQAMVQIPLPPPPRFETR